MTAKNLQDRITLNNGTDMPWFGLGVFKVEEGPELVQAVKTATLQQASGSGINPGNRARAFRDSLRRLQSFRHSLNRHSRPLTLQTSLL